MLKTSHHKTCYFLLGSFSRATTFDPIWCLLDDKRCTKSLQQQARCKRRRRWLRDILKKKYWRKAIIDLMIVKCLAQLLSPTCMLWRVKRAERSLQGITSTHPLNIWIKWCWLDKFGGKVAVGECRFYRG